MQFLKFNFVFKFLTYSGSSGWGIVEFLFMLDLAIMSLLCPSLIIKFAFLSGSSKQGKDFRAPVDSC